MRYGRCKVLLKDGVLGECLKKPRFGSKVARVQDRAFRALDEKPG